MSPTPKTTYPCLKCKVHVKQNDKAVKCSVCELWVHQTCGDIHDEVYKFLCKADKNGAGLHWMCVSCESANSKLNSRVLALETRIGSLETQTETNSVQIHKVANDMKAVSEDLSKTKESIDRAPEIAQDMVLSELANREKKKNNIILHNIAESTEENVKDRKAADMKSLDNVMKTIKVKLNTNTEDEGADVKFCVRLGEKNTDASKPRPMLIGLKDEQVKTKILQNAKNLFNSQLKDVSIVPDLTNKQRKDEQRMRQEVEDRNKELSQEESLNYEWRLIGTRGSRQVLKVRKRPQSKISGDNPPRTRRGVRGRMSNKEEEFQPLRKKQ